MTGLAVASIRIQRSIHLNASYLSCSLALTLSIPLASLSHNPDSQVMLDGHHDLPLAYELVDDMFCQAS